MKKCTAGAGKLSADVQQRNNKGSVQKSSLARFFVSPVNTIIFIGDNPHVILWFESFPIAIEYSLDFVCIV